MKSASPLTASLDARDVNQAGQGGQVFRPAHLAASDLMVVFTILGILAAVVVPQFSDAASAGRRELLGQQLRQIRAAVELYRAQHHDVIPDLRHGWNTLTTASDADGATVGRPLFGPYLPEPPRNAFTGDSAVADSPATGMSWWFDPATGTVTPLDGQGGSLEYRSE